MDTATIRIGTRGSALALAQATMVRDALEAAGVPASLTIITTEGDRRAPDTAWGEGAFVSAIESALLRNDVDVAVHSAKDVPTDEDPRLAIAAYLRRAPAGDVIVMPAGKSASSLDDLPSGTRVGTDSPRRTAFLRAVRPDLVMHPLHGNVDTRLRRLDEGQSDALVLAEAGLTRLGRGDRISFRLDPRMVPPAPGQGAVAVQVRADDARSRSLVGRLDDGPTRLAVEAERSILAASGGGCRAPLGAHGRVEGDRLELLAGFARPDGSLAVLADGSGAPGDPNFVDSLLRDLATRAAAAALGHAWPRVLTTRAADQSAALALALVDRGLAPLLAPTIEIQPAGDGLAPPIARLATFDWVVVTSSNAARAIRATADEAAVRLSSHTSGGSGSGSGDSGPRWAAIGVATARALSAAGIAIAHRPARASGAGVAETVPIRQGDRVLVPRSDLADDALIETLTQRGAEVEAVVAYRTVEAPAASLELLSAALAEAPAAVIFTSGSTARGLLTLADELGAAALVKAIPAICIGSATAAEAERLGFNVAATASSQAVAAIADATAGYLLPHEEKG